MKKLLLFAAAGLCLLVSGLNLLAAQDSSLTLRQVRDPVQLRASLNANAADAESRIAVVESGVTVTNAAAAFTVATNGIAALQAAASASVYVVNATQLVYVASGVTNLLDADITH